MPGRSEDNEGDGFLSRWSRRKLAPEPQPPALPAEPLPEDATAPPAEPAPEMVEPPSLDLVDKDFDVAHWLKQNVPESWKLAALRRAWESDPAISGYLDPARDYALDWNTPGGAPGYGPLSESDNVEEMLANIFGKRPEPAAEPVAASGEVRDDAAVVGPSSNEEEAEAPDAVQQEPARLAEEPEAVRLSRSEDQPGSARNAAELADAAPEGSVAAQERPADSPAPMRQRRRGGGATPL